jgi:sulfoxide reductase heme-binding subunit YedZ
LEQPAEKSAIVDWIRRNWHRLVVHIICVAALLWIGYYYFFGELATPVRFVMLRTGTIGLILLVASFACTPAARLLHWQGATQIRRALGLYGFLFIALHLFAYAYGDNELDPELILRDLAERRAMLIGTLSFALLIPLALTSTRGWQRRLGRRWKLLHRLVYIALPLGILHYFWLERDIITVPVLFALAVAFLFLFRLMIASKAGKKKVEV